MYREFHRHESEGNMNLQAPKFNMDEQAAVSLLQYMDKEQLQEFLDNPAKVETHIADLQQIKTIQRDRENIIVKNKSLAEYNVGLQPQFENLKQQVASAYEEVNALKIALGKDVANLDAAPGCQSHDTLFAIFQTESASADEKSEELAEEFCEGNIDMDTFLSEYLPKRCDAYTKKAKIEKASELFRRFSNTNSVPYPSNSSNQNSYMKPQTGNGSQGYTAPGYGAGSAPYPTPGGLYGGGGMPLPPYYQR